MSDIKQSTLRIGDRTINLPTFGDIFVFKTLEGREIRVDFSQVSSEYQGQRRVTVESDLLAGKQGRATENGVRTIDLSRGGTGAQVLPDGKRLAIELDEPILAQRRNEEGKVQIWSNPRWFRGVEA